MRKILRLLPQDPTRAEKTLQHLMQQWTRIQLAAQRLPRLLLRTLHRLAATSQRVQGILRQLTSLCCAGWCEQRLRLPFQAPALLSYN